jgi:hypothetical protein
VVVTCGTQRVVDGVGEVEREVPTDDGELAGFGHVSIITAFAG